jgi:hypothetical protein
MSTPVADRLAMFHHSPRVVIPDNIGYHVDGAEMPLPAERAVWRNQATGKTYRAHIGEDFAYWIEQPTEQEPMSAMERFNGLDAMLAEVRRDHQQELDAANKRIDYQDMELTMLRNQLAEAREAEQKWQRIATKFVSQFGTVRTIMDEVYQLALQIEPPPSKEAPTTAPAPSEPEPPPADQADEYTEEPPPRELSAAVPHGAGAGAHSGRAILAAAPPLMRPGSRKR